MSGEAALRVAYAEDEPDIREVGLLAMETLAGLTVEACADGLSLLEQAPTFKPDIIVLDIMMPGIDGIETFERLQTIEALRETPVVFMTARVQQTEIAQYRALGCAGIIEKPFDPMTLGAQIETIWRRETVQRDGGVVSA